MASIITGTIPPQNFEIVRDQIAAVLGDEMPGQYPLSNNGKIWVDRFIPINMETEVPTINVRFHKGDWDNESIIKSSGTYLFEIDIYTTANTNDSTGPADQYAIKIMNQIAGKVRAILAYPDYNNLGLTNGLQVEETSVVSYRVAYKGEVEDMLSSVVGRLQFMVKCIEYTAIPDNSKAINELTATINLNDSEFGYFYDYKQQVITVSATGPTLTDAFFSNPIIEITDVATGEVYKADVDFSKTGTTITAIAFGFTSGQIILAQTA